MQMGTGKLKYLEFVHRAGTNALRYTVRVSSLSYLARVWYPLRYEATLSSVTMQLSLDPACVLTCSEINPVGYQVSLQLRMSALLLTRQVLSWDCFPKARSVLPELSLRCYAFFQM